MAKKYLSYFQGSVEEWDAVDQRLLRHIIPENPEGFLVTILSRTGC